MKPAIDGETLIACSACAKAKAKCDRRLPTCSRCLFKRLDCEPRQPRRYPETYQLLASQSPSQSQAITFPASATHSPQDHADAIAVQEDMAQASALEIVDWHTHSEMAAGELSLEATDATMQEFDPSLLDVSAFLGAESMSEEFNLTRNNFGIETSQSQRSPSDIALSAGLPPDLRNSTASPHVGSASDVFGLSTTTDEDWPCFGCNPPTHLPINPKIGSEYLMRLERTLNEQPKWAMNDFRAQALDPRVHIEPIHEGLRDKLMVISQGFFSRARDIHHVGIGEATLAKRRASSNANFSGFFILPPAFILEAFLRTYASRVEPYMPFFPGGSINLTQLIASHDEKTSFLLLLMMIAQGAMGNASREAQDFASGLIETCRICIFDIMEKNVQLSAHPVTLRCALLYLQASAWSGNKWLMDLSAAQLHMFISMIKHARILDVRNSLHFEVDATTETEALWKNWQRKESLNRLACCWIKLDQEMNLFHDRQPILDINELNAPIPHSDRLWNATSADVWLNEYTDIHRTNPRVIDLNQHRPSLAALFRQFMSDELSENASPLSFTELRLLLHPLQTLIYHINKSLVYFDKSSSSRLMQRLFTQLEEVQYLLKQWYSIAQQGLRHSDQFAKHDNCNMILYHLVSLNALVYFPDVERLARGEISAGGFRESLWAGKRCLEDANQIWCHCGQVIRCFRDLPMSTAPYWWSASIYRVALCMWATSLVAETQSKPIGPRKGRELVAVDAHPFDHPSITQYLRHGGGAPTLSNADGTMALLNTSIDVLKHCIGVLGERGLAMQLEEGIKARLLVLVKRRSHPQE